MAGVGEKSRDEGWRWEEYRACRRIVAEGEPGIFSSSAAALWHNRRRTGPPHMHSPSRRRRTRIRSPRTTDGWLVHFIRLVLFCLVFSLHIADNRTNVIGKFRNVGGRRILFLVSISVADSYFLSFSLFRC